jgi:hypothetical protein
VPWKSRLATNNTLIERKVLLPTGATRNKGALLLHCDYMSPPAAALLDAL